MKFFESKLHLDSIDTLVFAGGGNRCWWQAGAITRLLEGGWKLPPVLVGTSAGAGVATSLLTCSARDALASCKRLYERNDQLFNWRSLAQLQRKFEIVNRGEFSAKVWPPSMTAMRNPWETVLPAISKQTKLEPQIIRRS